MRRRLFWWEWKKLWSVPMFSIFLVLCMVFNIFLTVENLYGQDYVNYVSEITEETGLQMGNFFDKKLEASQKREYKDTLIAETKGAEDIFETYQADKINTLLKNVFPMVNQAGGLLDAKYNRLQKSIGLLEKQDASLSVSSAGMTDEMLSKLFESLCRAIITEGWLLAAFMAIYLAGSETLSKTAYIVYSTKMGRKVQRIKYIASFLSGLLSYLFLTVIGIGGFCSFWDMGSVWDGSISSQFHHRKIALFKIPFITWKPFTVAEYLAAMLLLGVVVLGIFHAVSFGIGMVSGDAFRAFLILAGAGMFCVLANMLSADCSSFWLYQLTEWNPVMFWWKQYKWFTDMDLDSVLPWQECFEAVVCMVAAAGGLWLCRCRFNKMDL